MQYPTKLNAKMEKHSAAEASATGIYRIIDRLGLDPEEYSQDGYVPFVYAIVFENGDWYIGCKYSSATRNKSHPKLLLEGYYNSSSPAVQYRINRGSAHERYIIGLGDKHEVTALEKRIIGELWNVEGRLNGSMPFGIVNDGKALKGRKRSQETRDKMSKARKGHPTSHDTARNQYLKHTS